jgi:uncharacterized protein
MAQMSVFIAAFLFGIGLEIAQMTDPNKIIGFLNIFGKWDPSLAFVMIGAVITNTIAFRLITKRPNPLFADQFGIPKKTKPDIKVILGAGIFGIGWGVAGFCPGPAVSGSFRLQPEIFIVLASMFSGMFIFKLLTK